MARAKGILEASRVSRYRKRRQPSSGVNAIPQPAPATKYTDLGRQRDADSIRIGRGKKNNSKQDHGQDSSSRTFSKASGLTLARCERSPARCSGNPKPNQDCDAAHGCR